MIWLSIRTTARLLRLSNLEVVLLGRCDFLRMKGRSIQLKKGVWDESRFVERLRLCMSAVGGW
jgi:hypothetical protein